MSHLSKKLFVHMKSLLLSAIVAGFAAAVLVIAAHAQDSSIKWVCSPGYVWRDAFDGDLICVSPQRYAQVQDENRYASQHIDPNWTAPSLSSTDDCLQGYTWRLAGPDDAACVTFEASDQATYENDHPYDHRDIRYYYPNWGNLLFGGYRLDLCLNWNSRCGPAAAEHFCHFQGWTGARDFVEDPNIGASQATQGMLFDSGQVCNETECDGFKRITCYGHISGNRVYRSPKWQGHHLDQCLQGRDDCGKPAADAYCRLKGFSGTFYFFVGADFVSSNIDTITIGDKKVHAANKNRRQDFDLIICQ